MCMHEMNKTLEKFARDTLKENLSKLEDSNRLIFKRMYANGNLGISTDECVDTMDAKNLNWAMTQVESTKKGKDNE